MTSEDFERVVARDGERDDMAVGKHVLIIVENLISPPPLSNPKNR